MNSKESVDLEQQERSGAPSATATETAAPGAGAPAPGAPATGGAEGAEEVRRADFQPLTPRPGADASGNLGRLMDVVVAITIELGATEMPLGQVLELGPGSVVKLDRVVGDPVDILVNHELVGHGEVVVVDDCFGVRVTQLVDSTEERKWNGGRTRGRGAWPW